ncbi:MAG: hypothetical protein ACRDG3_10705 [Tepidiformaceae bacterium]
MDDSTRIVLFALYAVGAYAALYVIASRGAATALVGAIMLSSIFGTMVYFLAGLPAEMAIAFAAVSAIYLWLSALLMGRVSRALNRRSGAATVPARATLTTKDT